jgi:eukaryotic-like serine/threonine-protein kinase
MRVVAERYQLEEELARGGMGAVYAATDLKLDRKVAVKILIAWENADAFGRFEREAKVLARLRSDHVVQIHDYGIDQGVPYMVMELLQGESLGTLLKREERLGTEECLHILLQVARGLKAAHDAGLIHRDLKPSNIFLAKHSGGTIVKLLDFGMVKDAEGWQNAESTASGIVLGTPQYMSPEQARGMRDIDHRADLWSLGVILLRALTGANPFATESIGDAVIRICIDPIPLASQLYDLPLEFDEFFVKALARDPDERYQDADDVAQAFSSACGFGELDLALDASVMRGGLLSGAEPEGGGAVREPSVRTLRELSGASARSASSAVSLRTPRSTTVGGTQLASLVPRAAPRRGRLVAAGVAALALGGLLAFVSLRPKGHATEHAAATGTPTAQLLVSSEPLPPGPPSAAPSAQATSAATTTTEQPASSAAPTSSATASPAAPPPTSEGMASAATSAGATAAASSTLPPGRLKKGKYEPTTL